MKRGATRHRYQDRVDRAIRAIKGSGNQELTVRELAARAHMSVYQFCRAFRAVMGISPGAYQREKRLARAAVGMARHHLTVTDAALEAGYATPEAFARAFTRAAGVPPSRFRALWKQAALPPRQPYLAWPPSRSLAATTASEVTEIMDVEVKELEPLFVATVRHVGPYTEVGPDFKRLWGWAVKAGLVDRETIGVGASYDDPESTPAEQLRYDAAITVAEEAAAGVTPPPFVTFKTLPGGLYAVARVIGPYAQLPHAFSFLKQEWIQKSGYTGGARPAYELYINDCMDTAPEDLITDICLAIDPKAG